jgi:hypothetical protein
LLLQWLAPNDPDAEQWKQVDDCLLQPVSSNFAHSTYHFSVARIIFYKRSNILFNPNERPPFRRQKLQVMQNPGKAAHLSSSMKVYPKFRNPSHYQNQINKPISNFLCISILAHYAVEVLIPKRTDPEPTCKHKSALSYDIAFGQITARVYNDRNRRLQIYPRLVLC